jgi:hypothetical protein
MSGAKARSRNEWHKINCRWLRKRKSRAFEALFQTLIFGVTSIASKKPGTFNMTHDSKKFEAKYKKCHGSSKNCTLKQAERLVE